MRRLFWPIGQSRDWPIVLANYPIPGIVVTLCNYLTRASNCPVANTSQMTASPTPIITLPRPLGHPFTNAHERPPSMTSLNDLPQRPPLETSATSLSTLPQLNNTAIGQSLDEWAIRAIVQSSRTSYGCRSWAVKPLQLRDHGKVRYSLVDYVNYCSIFGLAVRKDTRAQTE
jgi:hypothetical protein